MTSLPFNQSPSSPIPTAAEMWKITAQCNAWTWIWSLCISSCCGPCFFYLWMLDCELKDWKSLLDVDAKDNLVDECVGWAYYLSVVSELNEIVSFVILNESSFEITLFKIRFRVYSFLNTHFRRYTLENTLLKKNHYWKNTVQNTPKKCSVKRYTL